MNSRFLHSRDAGERWVAQRYIASVPGGFAAAPFFAGGFAIQLVTFLTAVGLFAWSYRQVRPSRLGRGQEFFGLRIALGLYIAATFFAWVFMAGANSDGLNPRYLIFSLVPLGFSFASEVTLLYSLIRLAWQPLVHARAYKRSRAVGIGLCTWFAVTAVALWSAWAAQVAAEIHDVETDPEAENWSETFGMAEGAGSIIHLLYWCTGALWGLVVMGAAIDALRKSRGAVKSIYRVVPKLIIPASILWFARYVLFFMFTIEGQYGILFTVLNGNFYKSDFMPTLQPLLDNGLLLAVFVLAFLCFRPPLLDFYAESFGKHDPIGTTAAHGAELPGTTTPVEIGSVASKDGQDRRTVKGNESDHERHPAAFV